MRADVLTKGLDDTLFSIANTRFFPSYYSLKAIPQLIRKCKGVVRRRNGRSLEAMAKYDIGT